MDLPVWQRLFEELSDTPFLPIAVALESRGAAGARQWIEAANPTYPCLIDEQHEVARLYNMVNVPQACWIDENGIIVRPTETAGSTDGFRSMDRTTGKLDPEIMEAGRAKRMAYIDALRDWARNGSASQYVLSQEEAGQRTKRLTPEQAEGDAWFVLGEYLHRTGHPERAQAAFARARELRPESWAFTRQSLNLEHELGSFGPKFWEAVQALGDKPYYEQTDI